MRLIKYALIILLSLLTSVVNAESGNDATALYQQHCASCHGADRLGGMGPALLPENLSRLRKKAALRVIQRGKAATQMPGFADALAAEQIQLLVDYIYTSLPALPEWGLAEIQSSHIVNAVANPSHDKPVFEVNDPLNLFIVVELGDHHATLLDGTSLQPLHRFPTRFALHGGPKFSATGRYVYFASRDGWVSKFDIYNLQTVAEIRAGINTRNLALSADDRFVMVANYLPHTLVVLDAGDLSPIKIISVVDDYDTSSRVSAVYTAPPRHSFIAALKDLKEVWEIPYAEQAPALPVYKGIMHDYRTESGEAAPIDPGPFPIRRIRLDDYLDDFFFDPPYQHLIGAARDSATGQVVNLIVGRAIAQIDLPGLPHLGSGISWQYQGRPVIATPNLKAGVVSIIDMQNWQTIKRIDTLGPGFFMRSHENTPYAWVDVFFGKDRDALHVIDKRNLEIVKTLRPAPGKTAAHVEFDRHGNYVLVSIWDEEGAIVVYDAKTLAEIKRLPMRKPSGKYNIYNKITLSSGTSH